MLTRLRSVLCLSANSHCSAKTAKCHVTKQRHTTAMDSSFCY